MFEQISHKTAAPKLQEDLLSSTQPERSALHPPLVTQIAMTYPSGRAGRCLLVFLVALRGTVEIFQRVQERKSQLAARAEVERFLALSPHLMRDIGLIDASPRHWLEP